MSELVYRISIGPSTDSTVIEVEDDAKLEQVKQIQFETEEVARLRRFIDESEPQEASSYCST